LALALSESFVLYEGRVRDIVIAVFKIEQSPKKKDKKKFYAWGDVGFNYKINKLVLYNVPVI